MKNNTFFLLFCYSGGAIQDIGKVSQTDITQIPQMTDAIVIRIEKNEQDEDLLSLGNLKNHVFKVHMWDPNPVIENILSSLEELYESTPNRMEQIPNDDFEFDFVEQRHKLLAQTPGLFETRLTQFKREEMDSRFRLKAKTHFLNPKVIGAPKPVKLQYLDTQKMSRETKLKNLEYVKTKYRLCPCIPVSVMQSDAKLLKSPDHFFVWSPKTNGVRYFFIATTQQTSFQCSALINRANQMFLFSQLALPKAWYEGTVLDGEWIELNDNRTFVPWATAVPAVKTKKKQYCFMIHDCLLVNGRTCGEYHYLIRLQLAQMLVEHYYATVSAEKIPFEFRVKPVERPKHIVPLLQKIPTLDYDTDGLICTKVECAAISYNLLGQPKKNRMGQTFSIKKWKQSVNHTVDFQPEIAELTPTSLKLHLYCLEDKKRVRWTHDQPIQVIPLPAKEKESLSLLAEYEIQNEFKQLRSKLDPHGECKHISDLFQGQIYEFRYVNHGSSNQKQWVIEQRRFDKLYPNRIETVRKTWQNITENLALSQIFAGIVSPKELEWLHQYEANALSNTTTPNPMMMKSKTKPTLALAPLPLRESYEF
jgi:hypothetical protein